MKLLKTLIVLLLTLAAMLAFAQTNAPPPASPAPPPSAPVKPSESELEKLVAPIALYPDPLLAVLLPASAYPVEIVQAARFVKDTNNVPKIDSQPWDDNVKALARFPDVIAKMDADIGWTSKLGQAFVDDQKSIMGAIQAMRGKAQQAGSLKTSPQQVVVTTNEVVQQVVEQQTVYVTNTIVQIQPAQPQVIYVPQYNPSVVYAPGPAYAYDPVAPLVTFGVGMALGAAIANNCDWHSGGVYVGPRGGVAWGGGHYHGDVDVDVNRNVNVNRSANVNQTVTRNGQQWQPDPARRTSTGTAATPEARGWGDQASANASAARTQASENAAAARAQGSERASAARSQGSENAAAARAQASERASAARAQGAPGTGGQQASGAGGQGASATRAQASERASSARAQGQSAFNTSGGAAQARASSARGSFSGGGSRGGGGGRRR